MYRSVAAALAMCAIVTPAAAQQLETGFLNRTVTVAGTTYRYQVYVPAEYDPAVAWPVILFLHGGGERGSDGLLQTQVGLAAAIRSHRDRYPAIVVLPQAPAEPTTPASVWQDVGDVALAALDRTQAEFRTDSARVYLTGMSQGGNGTWYLAYHQPQRFAALVVICGWVVETGGRPGVFGPTEDEPYVALARRIRHLPIWIFHGDEDTVIPVDESRRMHDALRTLGSDVRYTEIAGGNHNAWDPAYLSPDLPIWLFEQRRH